MKRKTSILILLVIALLIFFVFSNKEVEYQGKKYELRNDEYGVMLFFNNGGEYSVVKSYVYENGYLLNLYDYQRRKAVWVRMYNGRLTDVDSVKFNFLELQEVPTQTVLK